MVAYNYGRTRATADRLIRKFGRSRAAVLRRDGVDRKISVVMLNYSTSEVGRSGGLIQSADQRAYVSAVDLDIPPDNERDVLVIGSGPKFVAPFEEWRIVAPPIKLDPAGTVVYWELQVRA